VNKTNHFISAHQNGSQLGTDWNKDVYKLQYLLYLHIRNGGNLFNLVRLRAKTKVRKVLIRKMRFADDSALIAHSREALQRLTSSLAHAGREFCFTISLKKINVLGQVICSATSVEIEEFTISSNLCMDTELYKMIGKAETAMARLTKRVWDNANRTTKINMDGYKACVLSKTASPTRTS